MAAPAPRPINKPTVAEWPFLENLMLFTSDRGNTRGWSVAILEREQVSSASLTVTTKQLAFLVSLAMRILLTGDSACTRCQPAGSAFAVTGTAFCALTAREERTKEIKTSHQHLRVSENFVLNPWFGNMSSYSTFGLTYKTCPN